MQEFHDALSRHPLLVGLLGAVVASARSSPGKSWGERMVNIACGGILSAYLSPAIGVWIGVEDAAQLSALAFLTGMTGMTIVGGLLTAIRSIDWKTIAESWLKKRD